MQLNDAKWSGGVLTLHTNDPEAVRFCAAFEAGEYEIAKAKKKRSLDANAYAWVLMDKLAAATGIPKADIYRNAIKNIGGNSDVVCVREAAADSLCEGWRHNGLGWQTERLPSKLPGCVNVILYYGSSTYNTKQMSRLIDSLVQDARALGIETEDENKIKSLLEAWDG